MSLSSNKSSIGDRVRLAHALGFNDYPTNSTAEPYLNYIQKQYAGSETIEVYIDLFIEVIEHFRPGAVANGTPIVPTVRTLTEKYALSGFRDVFADTLAGDPRRKEHVEDTVMCIIGTWTMMLSSFQYKNRSRKVVAAYSIFTDATISQTTTPITPSSTTSTPPSVVVAPYDNSVAGLIAGSGLLPGGQWDHRISVENDATMRMIALMFNAADASNRSPLQTLLSPSSGRALPCQTSPYALLEELNAQESLSIRATRLNAFTLNVLSAVDILWTPNVSRHMLLTKISGRFVLELFSLPCAFDAITSPAVGIPVELTQEIEESYAVLFNAWPNAPFHAKFGALVGLRKVCWCWSCSAYRYRQRCITAWKTRAPVTPRRKSKVASNLHNSDFDPTLETLMTSQSMSDWTPEDFPTLWPRIARLEQHLQTSRPWSLGVLFRDRRDTMQFWTFLFATVVVFLTVVQVLLGVAQVVGSFI
ncbi:uncharacterized protein CC84DRAFT_1197442 [Paraphaeosphaeria sporulosa]|uniref:Uncharacterized protein n=1 Tax=Paraphaeosphaeria sporulosa TaxID=1460663 RepID=A0A177C863_9PLEO|nr:uncharacterized protein CC84DRAFT_1197442 [Paraphaeosphaeria sporulosa]OAG03833.1 hypothetical protein CC84DRAFT_1197442 [Paraphaeosphaeria sporulosa]